MIQQHLEAKFLQLSIKKLHLFFLYYNLYAFQVQIVLKDNDLWLHLGKCYNTTLIIVSK